MDSYGPAHFRDDEISPFPCSLFFSFLFLGYLSSFRFAFLFPLRPLFLSLPPSLPLSFLRFTSGYFVESNPAIANVVILSNNSTKQIVLKSVTIPLHRKVSSSSLLPLKTMITSSSTMALFYN